LVETNFIKHTRFTLSAHNFQGQQIYNLRKINSAILSYLTLLLPSKFSAISLCNLRCFKRNVS
jgi:hypothetical protein